MTSHRKVIAHRGSSAYAPENTIPAFELAIQQGAGCLEHDLQVTKDGVLVCLHDSTLERTTNVREVFPGRARDVEERGTVVQRSFVHDFTMAEIRELEAGSWFSQRWTDVRVPTFEELLDFAHTRVAVLTEIKDVELYESLGVDPLRLCVDALSRHGLLAGEREAGVTVQSFHEPTVQRGRPLLNARVPVALLVEPADAARLGDQDSVRSVARFADGIGPGKSIVADRPEVVRWAHQAGLRVTPWTFRVSAVGHFESVTAEIAHYLDVFGVDAVITDHPDAYRADLGD